MRGYGTALGSAPHRLAITAAPEFLGSGGAAPRTGVARADRLGRHGDGRALSNWRAAPDQPRPVATARICPTHGAAHGRRPDRLTSVQPRLRGVGREEPHRRENTDPSTRHPAIGTN